MTGEVDAYTAPKVRGGLLAAIDDPNVTEIRVDLAGVAFLDSSGISVLIRRRNEAESRDIEFVVSNPQPQQARVLDFLGLTEFFGISIDHDHSG